LPQDYSTDAVAAEERDLLGLSLADKPTIRILLYTDDRQEVVNRPVGTFGLGRMIRQLRAHAPAFADLDIQYETRYPAGSSEAKNKIHVVLAKADEAKKTIDQIWFFGLHQVNKKNFKLGLGGGGPESELDTNEVNELRCRMDAGLGVLMTGDHANKQPLDALPPDPNSPCPDPRGPNTFLGLGRALGRCVPRAGLLRDWEDSPTAAPRDRYDTQVVTFGTGDENQLSFESDNVPQQLILRTFNETGRPKLEGQPHPLFFYKGGRAIQLFPDHPHEGAVVIPEDLKECDWPKYNGFQPKPRVVAYGLDKRNGRRLKLVAAYNGDGAHVGRIVADSTWHHYFNVNLENFQRPLLEDSAADQIGQFYGNLALWLSPLGKRYEMFDAMVRWLVDHPVMAEEVGPVPSKRLRDLVAAGGIARRLLSKVASPCEIHELLQMAVDERYFGRYETLYLPEKGFHLNLLPSKELLLGYLVHHYQQVMTETLGLTLSDDALRGMRRKAAVTGSESAFRRQAHELERTAMSALKFFERDNTRSSILSEKQEPERSFETPLDVNQPSQRSNTMAACEIDPTVPFNIDLILDKDPNTSERITFRNVRNTAGVITGDVFDENEKMSDLTGTCAPITGTGEANLSLLTFIFGVRDNRGQDVRIFLSGVAFPISANPTKLEFHGALLAFEPITVTPTVTGGQLEDLPIDPGDTGTGNGNQT
jgi:hypothetical protein